MGDISPLPESCNNPASRLYNLLVKIKGPQPQANSLQKKMGIGDDPVAFFNFIAEFHQELQRLADAVDLMQEASPKKIMFSESLHVLTKEVQEFTFSYKVHSQCNISDSSMNSLRYMAVDFQNEIDCGALINDIRNKISELQQMIEDSSLDLNLKKWLLSLLRTLRDGLDRYNISGAKSIDEEFTKIIGELTLNKEMTQQVKETDQSITEKFKEIVELLKNIKTFYTTCKPIAEELALRLPYFL